MTTAQKPAYADASTEVVAAAEGADYAHRDVGTGTVPLVLLAHFRGSAITQPVFIANGDSDPMIPPRYSYLLAGLIPDATVKIYPDSAHGFLFQHHAESADDVEQFLAGSEIDSSSNGGPDE